MDYANVKDLLNVQDSDMDLLVGSVRKQFCENERLYEQIEKDYDDSKMINISAMEYKHYLFLTNFIESALNAGIEQWINYHTVVDSTIEKYALLLNVTNHAVTDINNSKEKKNA